MDEGVYLAGQLENWPTKSKMASILRAEGLTVNVGNYSIRIEDCEHFVIQEYGGDLGDPQFDADASSLELMLNDAGRVSAALTSADIRHSFEFYDDQDQLVGYLHHNWPQS